MNTPIPRSVIVLSGIVTGMAAVLAITYAANRQHTQHSTETSQAARLRRTRSIRRRRGRQNATTRTTHRGREDGMLFPLQVPLSDSEDDADHDQSSSIFRGWDDDEHSNLLKLLCAISNSQSRKEGYVHRGITCNKCEMAPIRGIRYKCANCIDFDICEMCEAKNNHINTHVFLKIRIPIPPLSNPRNALLLPFYPGKNNHAAELNESKYHELQQNTHFDRTELESLYEQFKALSTEENRSGGISRETFDKCLGPLGWQKNLIAGRVFSFFDQNGDGVISFDEMTRGLSVLSKGNFDEKVKYAFQGYDLNNDGYISREELFDMYKSYFYLSMELVRDLVSAMEDEMMDNYEFSAWQPVSAAFNVAIQSSSSDHESDQELNGNPEEIHEARLDVAEGEAGPSRPQRPVEYPIKEDHFSEYLMHEEELESNTILESNDIEEKQFFSDLSEPTTLPGMKGNEKGKDTLNMQTQEKTLWEEKHPIMHMMCQQAIHVMVDKTFNGIKTEREGYLSFDEFKQCVQTDSSIVSWFESLGTIF